LGIPYKFGHAALGDYAAVPGGYRLIHNGNVIYADLVGRIKPLHALHDALCRPGNCSGCVAQR
jgi:hypothetical protein